MAFVLQEDQSHRVEKVIARFVCYILFSLEKFMILVAHFVRRAFFLWSRDLLGTRILFHRITSDRLFCFKTSQNKSDYCEHLTRFLFKFNESNFVNAMNLNNSHFDRPEIKSYRKIWYLLVFEK